LVCVAAGLLSWGFAPHKQLHAKAWSYLPGALKQSWGWNPDPLIQGATAADSRKHTDSLEAERHYLDLDDLRDDSLDIWGLPWFRAERIILGKDSISSSRRFGVLPWELERAYHRLVRAWNPGNGQAPRMEQVIRAASDLGHYIADAHVPLHTTGNYNGQRTGQLGIHALWETQALEWMLWNEKRHCPCYDPTRSLPYDPVWTPWEIIAESHAMLPELLAAHHLWKDTCQTQGYGFQRRGRTLQVTPTPAALALWDSLTQQTTWPRFCLASQRISAAWFAAWVEAGRPSPPLTPQTSLMNTLASYLDQLRGAFKRVLHQR